MEIINDIEGSEHNLCLTLYHLVVNKKKCECSKIRRELINTCSVDDDELLLPGIYTVVKIHMYCEKIKLERDFSTTVPLEWMYGVGENDRIIDDFNSSRLENIMYFRFLVKFDIFTRKFKLRDNIMSIETIRDFFLDPLSFVTKYGINEKIHNSYVKGPRDSFDETSLSCILDEECTAKLFEAKQIMYAEQSQYAICMATQKFASSINFTDRSKYYG